MHDHPLPLDLVVTNRPIVGMSAVLLPWAGGAPDWTGFAAHVERTVAAGLTPAVNMDTGFGQLLTVADRTRATAIARDLSGGDFVAGAHCDDAPGDGFEAETYLAAVEPIIEQGGTPILFTGHALAALEEPALIDAYAAIGAECGRFYAFELGRAFSPTGRVLSLDGFRDLLAVPTCIGLKHSSLERQPEWDRLRIRNESRPDFTILTGNDLAIDMVMYGSDYLLGLSTFAPDVFATRDAYWAAGDARFHEVNDALQALGSFAFRPPVPSYRHSAATFLRLQGWIANDEVPSMVAARPAGDIAVLEAMLQRLAPYRP